MTGAAVNSENSYQKFSREVLIAGIMTALTSLSDVVLLPLLTKTLGAGDYGLWAQMQATVNLVIPIASLGLPFAMVRFLAAQKDRETARDGFYSIVTIVALSNLAVSLLFILFPGPIADNFFDGAYQVVRMTGLLILIFALNGAFLAFFRAFRRVKTYAILNVLRSFSEIGLAAALVLKGYGILGAVMALVIIRAALFIVTFFFIRFDLGIKRPAFLQTKEYLRFSLPNLAGSMTSWVISLSDRYVIAFFLGAVSVGIYSAGYAVANACILFSDVLAFVLPAASSQLYDEGKIEEVKTHLKYSLKYILMVAIPFVFGATILSEPVLRLFTTPEIASEGHWVVPVISLGLLFVGIGTIPWQILVVTKKTRVVALAWSIAAVCNLVLNILFIPRLGILGAAGTTAFSYLLVVVIESRYAFKHFKPGIDWLFIIKSLLASGVMALFVWFVKPEGNIATILTVLLGTAVYFVLLFLLRGISRQELAFFQGVFQKPARPGSS